VREHLHAVLAVDKLYLKSFGRAFGRRVHAHSHALFSRSGDVFSIFWKHQPERSDS